MESAFTWLFEACIVCRGACHAMLLDGTRGATCDPKIQRASSGTSLKSPRPLFLFDASFPRNLVTRRSVFFYHSGRKFDYLDPPSPWTKFQPIRSPEELPTQ